MNYLKLLALFANNSVELFLVIFLLSLIHSFLPPIPIESSLVVFIGYLSATGRGQLVMIWLGSIVGNSLGNLLIYRLASARGLQLIQWKLLKSQLTHENIKKTSQWFQQYGVWTIFIGKIIPGMIFVVLFCCGLFRLRRNQVLSAIGGANLLYYSGLVLLSRYLGQRWRKLSGFQWHLIPWISVIILIGVSVAVYLFLKKRSKLKNPNS